MSCSCHKAHAFVIEEANQTATSKIDVRTNGIYSFSNESLKMRSSQVKNNTHFRYVDTISYM